jgi:hypothetical protein
VNRLFLLSPANSAGRRAGLLFRQKAQFDLARRLRLKQGVPIGEVFSFLSGLYFRGKLTYATAFANPPDGIPGALVITSSRGLLDARCCVTLGDLQRMAKVPIDENELRYRRSLLRSARQLHDATPADCEVVLLGSIATGKYVNVLRDVFADRLKFPVEFVGRGDMSRGGLMLRCASSKRELIYGPVNGAVRHGSRPPKLHPLRRAA